MFIKSLHLHRDFANSNFWTPELEFSSQIIHRRRYSILKGNEVISIKRTWNDIFDSMGMEQIKRRCIAKGTLKKSGTTINLSLEITLDGLITLLFWFCIGFSVLGGIILLFLDWKVGLGWLAFGIISFIGTKLYASFVLREFYAELKQDIEFFKTNETTKFDLPQD